MPSVIVRLRRRFLLFDRLFKVVSSRPHRHRYLFLLRATAICE